MSLALPTVRSWRLSRWPAVGALTLLHGAALYNMYWTESAWFNWALFLLVWGFFNACWLMLLARPALAAALSLAVTLAIIALSEFKFATLWMSIDFFDILVIDPDTFRFLLAVVPELRASLVLGAVLAVPAAFLLWRFDPLRVRRKVSALAALGFFAGIFGIALVAPRHPSDIFYGVNHISGFAHSGVTAIPVLMQTGWIESEARAGEKLRAFDTACQPTEKPPHIVMVLDESSFDIRTAPGIKVPADYGGHFRSFDGKQRTMLVEGAGGPTWYTEYNVLTGLSARSFGRFSYQVTRVAAGHVKRGLPQALRRCGYKTFTVYPAHNAFLAARRFQEGVGVDRMFDARDMRQGPIEPDSFFFSQAMRVIDREGVDGKPLFVFAYTQANHFPWTFAFRPDLTPDWRAPGNGFEVDEYLRRQAMSAKDYREFIATLKDRYPRERFLVVRFGDHQPPLAARLMDPQADEDTILRRIVANDPRYYSTYYAIEPVNYRPADLSSALDTLDAAYLPLLIQEAAGLPLDPSFAEQKRILARCNGQFSLCAGGAEARRFNRLLIDAGLIEGLAR